MPFILNQLHQTVTHLFLNVQENPNVSGRLYTRVQDQDFFSPKYSLSDPIGGIGFSKSVLSFKPPWTRSKNFPHKLPQDLDLSVNPSGPTFNSHPIGLFDFRVFLVSDPSVNLPLLTCVLLPESPNGCKNTRFLRSTL